MFEIKHSSGGFWYIALERAERCYWLLPSGVLTSNDIFAMTEKFDTKDKAEKFLDKWLPKLHWIEFGGCSTNDNNFAIDWLTVDEIKKRAGLGDKEALDCSVEHWKQIAVAGYEEYKKTKKKSKTGTGARYCALCKRNNCRCTTCLICQNVKHIACYGTPHVAVRTALENNSKEEFEKAAIEELNFLVKLRNELYGDPYKENKEMRTINIDGKEFSEETVKEALKKHCDFEEGKKEERHIFKPGDVALYEGMINEPRIILKGKATDFEGVEHCKSGQKDFEYCDYRYIGQISDFINEDTILRFQGYGEV